MEVLLLSSLSWPPGMTENNCTASQGNHKLLVWTLRWQLPLSVCVHTFSANVKCEGFFLFICIVVLCWDCDCSVCYIKQGFEIKLPFIALCINYVTKTAGSTNLCTLFSPLLFWSYFFVLHVTVLVCSAYGELYQLGWRLSLRLHWQMLNADEHSHFALWHAQKIVCMSCVRELLLVRMQFIQYLF